jgi:hypothetical protein
LFSYVITGTSSEDDFQRFIMFKPIRSNGDHLGCLVTFNTEHNFGKGPSKEYITSRFEPVWDGWFLRRRSKCKMLIDNRRQAMGKAHVNVVDCPDLTQKPFNLSAPGMHSNKYNNIVMLSE